MNRLALLAAAALVMTSPVLAQAAPGKQGSPRTLTHEYAGISGLSTPAADTAQNECDTAACWEFATVKGEKTVTLEASDDSGLPAAFQVYLDGDYTGVQTMCGSGTVKVKPNRATAVSVRLAPSDACPGLPTTGTLKAVITNR